MKIKETASNSCPKIRPEYFILRYYLFRQWFSGRGNGKENESAGYIAYSPR